MTLLEIALKQTFGASRIKGSGQTVLRALESNPRCDILPITIDIALEIAALGDALRDPADRTIVATARVHRLKLVTSDERIINSDLVPVIE